MKIGLIGAGWVTPAGRSLPDTCGKVLRGDILPPVVLPEAPRWPVLKVPADLIGDSAALPRLRRSSTISHLAVAAARDAVAAARLTPEDLFRTALIFTTSDGGVVYTRRFHADIVERGGGAGSPLLFPETVYNAPASHVAAALGLTSEVLTLVGDGAAALGAIHTAAELLHGDATHCLVVAAQEVDWISAEAYGRWSLIHGSHDETAYFAEGAAAVVLARQGTDGPCIAYSDAGVSYSTNREASGKMTALLQKACAGCPPAHIVGSQAGNGFDRVEDIACRTAAPSARVVRPKRTLGDALAASALQQIIVADHLIRQGEDSVLVTAAGYNGQLGALLLTQAPR